VHKMSIDRPSPDEGLEEVLQINRPRTRLSSLLFFNPVLLHSIEQARNRATGPKQTDAADDCACTAAADCVATADCATTTT
jgi:hypothetical protein